MALVIKNEKILMVYDYYGHYFWSLSGGGIEAGKSPEQTAIRELKEENQEAIDGFDPEEMSAPEEERRGVKKTEWKNFDELSRLDQDYLVSAGYLNK